jgi:hypothetical protein
MTLQGFLAEEISGGRQLKKELADDFKNLDDIIRIDTGFDNGISVGDELKVYTTAEAAKYDLRSYCQGRR